MASSRSDLILFDEHGRTDAEIYLTDVYDGKIVACKEMRQLADMMLPRFHEPYKQWHFDPEKAVRPVKWLAKYACFPEGKKMGKPFITEQFQRMPIEIAFGFVDDEGLRQFRQVFMMLGRKNGKTSLLAGLMLYMMTSDIPIELGAEIYACSTSEQQSHKLFGAADAMRLHSPSLAKRLRRGKVQKRGQSGLNYDKTGSFLIPLSSNVGHLDGLSCSGATVDELMCFTDNGALLDLLEESTSARLQPLVISISTENYVRQNIGDERLTWCQGVLKGDIHDDRILPAIWKQDSRDEIFSEELWAKSNPGLLCGIKDWEYLRDRVNKAKQSPARMPSLLTKEFNLRSGAYSAFLDIEDCVNMTPIDFPLSEIPYCVVGFDLATKGDLCAAVARFMRPYDTNIYEISRFWIPEKSIEINSAKDIKERDKVPYRQWSADGWIEILYGEDRVNNYHIITFLQELVDIGCYPFAVAYDNWHVEDSLERDLKRLVGETRCFAVPQTAKSISPLLREMELDLKAKKVINPSPVAHWCRSNVSVRADNNNNIMAQKRDLQPNRKIDGMMAELFALSAMKRFEEEYLNAIEWEPPEGQDNPFATS